MDNAKCMLFSQSPDGYSPGFVSFEFYSVDPKKQQTMPKAFPILCISLSLVAFSCQPPPQELILGSWKVDSVYAYYNGFDYWEYKEGADWAAYEYTADGQMKEVKFDTYRPYQYRIAEDTLFWIAQQEPNSGAFQILELRPDYMVLRKDKAPIFSGRRQDRYEIRFFSRTRLERQPDAYLPDHN